MPTTLSRLPPSILALLTSHLCASSLTKLVILSGDSTLLTLSCCHGGVTELAAVSPDSVQAVIAPRSPLLSYFTKLTSLILSCDQFDRCPLVSYGFSSNLPPTLTDLRIALESAFDIWLRPVDEVSDSASLKSLVVYNDFVPAAVSQVLPILKTLHIRQTKRMDYNLWPKRTLLYLFATLPTSITSLEIDWSYSYPVDFHETPLTGLFSAELLQNLSHLRLGVFVDPIPFQTLISPSSDLNPSYATPIVSARSRIADSTVRSVPNAPALASLFYKGRLSFDSVVDLPPSNIQSLSFTAVNDLDLLPISHLFPHLQTLEIHGELETRLQHDSLYILSLPNTLTSLALGRSTIRLAQMLPPTLTRLSLATRLTTDFGPLRLDRLIALKELTISAKILLVTKSVPSQGPRRLSNDDEESDDKSATETFFELCSPLPPSLTSLIILKTCPIGLIEQLPGTLLHVTASLNLSMNDALKLARLSSWTQTTFWRHLIAQFTSNHVPLFQDTIDFSIDAKQTCLITRRFGAGLAPAVYSFKVDFEVYFLSYARDKETFNAKLDAIDLQDNYAPEEHCPEPSSKYEYTLPFKLPATLTSIRALQSRLRSNLMELPPRLQVLHIGYFYVHQARIQGRRSRDGRYLGSRPNLTTLPELPTTLRELKIQEIRGYTPAFEKLSNLQVLSLGHLSSTFPSAYLQNFPPHITDLTLHFAEYSQDPLWPQIPLSMILPKLRHLRIINCCLSLRAVIDVLPTLETLQLPEFMFVESSLVPAFVGSKIENITEIDQMTIVRHILETVLPKHLQRTVNIPRICIVLEWNEELLNKLPRGLIRLHLMIQLIGDSLPDLRASFAQFSKLQLLKLRFLPTTEEPDSEKDEMAPTRLGTIVDSLPQSITSLELDASRIHDDALTPQMLSQLPRTLQRLILNVHYGAQETSHFDWKTHFSLLPPNLRYFSSNVTSLYNFVHRPDMAFPQIRVQNTAGRVFDVSPYIPDSKRSSQSTAGK